MAHYSEMNFLFSDINKDEINRTLDNTSKKSTFNVFKGEPHYIVYKGKYVENSGIQNQLKTTIYEDDNSKNPYIKILNKFKTPPNTPGAGLNIKASDLAYLKDLGVYPINRMAILRRYPDGSFVPENLEEMSIQPLSTVIGWIKEDQSFPTINFQETWGKTNKRFDVKLKEIIEKQFSKGGSTTSIIPIPDFAQAILFESYKRADLTDTGYGDDNFELYDDKEFGNWGLNNIPIGDPNVLQEAPFRDPETQNIVSNISFELETTYEQKLLGDVDPGSAMLDILDNLFAMGTSNMRYYWSENSPSILKAREATKNSGNDINAWWIFISEIMSGFWSSIQSLFDDVKATGKDIFESITDPTIKTKDVLSGDISSLLKTIITSTLAIHRFELRGTIELMTGGKTSSTPWHLTLGNPLSPWISTPHIIIDSATIDTSTEMGFNDQPQWIKVKFSCKLSRSLGKQELLRLFNNSYRRTYSKPPLELF